MKVAILYICTGKYVVFWRGFFDSCERRFLNGVEKHYFVFTDQTVNLIDQDNLGWPDNTLARFDMFSKIKERLADFDYIFFFNANCRFHRKIDESFLPCREEGLVVIQHPGFFNKPADTFPYERNPLSAACMEPGQGRHYVCGGINGGTADAFLKFVEHAKAAVSSDRAKGQTALWHDESHLNRYIVDHPYKLEHPGYCFPQGWKMPFRKMIEVRDKRKFGGHASLRGTQGEEESTTGHTVYIRIFGGLGNQMFQYACGRAAALRSGGELVLDSREFVAGPGQLPSLHHFNIAPKTVSDSELPPLKKQRLRYMMWRRLRLPPRLVRQNGDAFDPSILQLKNSVWLWGYWQSERFFADFSDEIRRELSIKTPADTRNSALLEEIRARPAVSVHVRRGDYVNNPKAKALHGSCSLEYYGSAARLIADKTGLDPVFYLFSDDPEWVKDNLALPFEMRVVDHNDSQANYEDLRLMSACQHHIIANSSFSWWGAWLNPSKSKMVVAPKKWFQSPSIENPDILPDHWIRLDN